MSRQIRASWSRPRRFAGSLGAAAALALLGTALAPRLDAANSAQPSAGGTSGRASVQLVRFLDEVSETDRARFGPLHDIRLRLETGFVVLVRREGDFAAILPIDARGGSPDSLQYFWYLERGPLLWLIPRGRDRGVRTVADGGDIRFDSFTLRWGKGGDRGWLYFPDIPENRGVRVSVVSGNSVDRVDPRDTRYWVELGANGAGGF
ncbi:MAG TPA: hypothetical protein VI198_07130 [Candidatus Eisenbacteria bacterium]